VKAHLTPEAIDHLLEPGNHTGSAGAMVDAVLTLARAEGLA